MKKIISAFLFLTMSALGAVAQDKGTVKIDTTQVPVVVKTTFNSTFPNSSNVEWKKKNSNYAVSFTMNDIAHHAKLDSTGKIIMRGKVIPISELPAAVTTAVQKDYPDYKISKVFAVMENDITSYKISFDRMGDQKVVYDANGTRLKE